MMALQLGSISSVYYSQIHIGTQVCEVEDTVQLAWSTGALSRYRA